MGYAGTTAFDVARFGAVIREAIARERYVPAEVAESHGKTVTLAQAGDCSVRYCEGCRGQPYQVWSGPHIIGFYDDEGEAVRAMEREVTRRASLGVKVKVRT